MRTSLQITPVGKQFSQKKMFLAKGPPALQT